MEAQKMNSCPHQQRSVTAEDLNNNQHGLQGSEAGPSTQMVSDPPPPYVEKPPSPFWNGEERRTLLHIFLIIDCK
jgi:hypothetical protein